MPLLTDCAWCGERFVAETAGTMPCPHCSQPVTVVRQKTPAADYWPVVKIAGWLFFAAVLLFAFGSSFLR